MELNENYDAETWLAEWWPIVLANFRAIKNAYDAEESARTTADSKIRSELQVGLQAEKAARENADRILDGKITDEATTREAEDDAIANGTREINPMLGFDTTYRKAGQAPKSIADGLNMLTLLSGQTDEFNLDGSFRADWLRAAVLFAGKLRIGADYIATWDNKSISEGLSMLTGIVESGTESDVYKCLKDVVFTDNYFDFGNIIVSGEEDWYYPENECNDYDLLTVGRKIKFTIDASSNNARHSWLSIHVPFGSFYLWVHHKDTFWEGRTYTAIITTKNGLNTEYNFSDGEAYVIEDSSNADYLSEIAKKILKIPTYATEAEIREAWNPTPEPEPTVEISGRYDGDILYVSGDEMNKFDGLASGTTFNLVIHATGVDYSGAAKNVISIQGDYAEPDGYDFTGSGIPLWDGEYSYNEYTCVLLSHFDDPDMGEIQAISW